jgi:hypothetical protein
MGVVLAVEIMQRKRRAARSAEGGWLVKVKEVDSRWMRSRGTGPPCHGSVWEWLNVSPRTHVYTEVGHTARDQRAT